MQPTVKILTENVLTTFADLVGANRRRLYRLWLIAPWVGTSEASADPVTRILDALRGTRCRLLVITRPPAMAWHVHAVKLLAGHTYREIFCCPSLHTKLYILECDGFRAAVLGSPNLTAAADTENRELAVEFRTTAQGREHPSAALVSQLLDYASSLRNQEDVVPCD